MDQHADVELPEWARALLESTAATSGKPPSILEHRGSASWPLLVDAATVATFLPRELDLRIGPGAERKEAERSVLRFAEPAQDAGGARWSLTREARNAVLTACEPGDIEAAVDRTSLLFNDRLTVALRASLREPHLTDYESLSIEDLSARRLIATWLRGTDRFALPPLEELDRQIELRRLLAPFERMTGKLTAGAGDRFFGRAAEMEDLRAYVGVVAADTFGQKVLRAAKSVARVFTGRQPKTVWGTGGAGKTTLIAKFMLEHARAADARFPFAYLDFDRATITARNRAGLLAEMCRQVGAQFHELTGPMASLRSDLAEAARKIELSPESDSISLLSPLAMRFRSAIDEALDSSTPFLLVFDTFEVVQYGPDQVQALEELVRAFTGSDHVWSRLRLIISGRRKVSQFLGSVEELILGALDLEGSAQMLRALAGDAGKSVSVAESERLVSAIAKSVGDKTNTGVRPLRLRLVCELFRNNSSSGPEIVHSLLAELKKPPSEQQLVGKLLVDGILVRRILGHVTDRRVRALADPGLVVRRITKDVIRDVMTRGTQKPTGTDSGDGSIVDADPIEPWIVDDTEAQDIFDAFRNEVSLVESDGDALRHRQDVRQEMLPLIEARQPKGFRRVQELAFHHFRDLAEKDERDVASAEEALYHGLWLDEPLEELDRFVARSSKQLRIDPDEFEAGSPRNLYLRAKNKEQLAAEEVFVLPRGVAIDWLAARTEALLTQRRLVEEIPILRAVGGPEYQHLDARPDVAASVARLLYRAGQWGDAAMLLERHIRPESSMRGDASISMLRTWATIAAKGGIHSDRWGRVILSVESIHDPLVRTEVLAHGVLGVQLSGEGNLLTETTEQMMKAALEVSPSAWRRELRILRLAIATRPVRGMEELLRRFVDACDQLPHDRSVAELVSEMRGAPTTLNQLDEVWRREKSELLHQTINDPKRANALCRIATADHGDWFLPLGNALTRAMMDETVRSSMRSRLPSEWSPEAGRAIDKQDGHSLVQVLVAEGVLLQAATLFADPDPSPPSLPQTAPQLAAALVRWHRATSPDPLEMAP